MARKYKLTKGGRLYISNDDFFNDDSVQKVIERLNKSKIVEVIEKNNNDLKEEKNRTLLNPA